MKVVGVQKALLFLAASVSVAERRIRLCSGKRDCECHEPQ